MSEARSRPLDRAAFHQRHQAEAVRQAQRLLDCRSAMQGAWFDWVAAQLYQMDSPPFVAMVRRELQRLVQSAHDQAVTTVRSLQP
ncbi:hypothetical protein [uncultured Pseudomonas sp.]|uniref:hypothetical protein n=1 Tax=uncultured Pseudomonas sp. TaxID=114707 RepID=UPI0025EFF43C|nr:hypothetical protein [uncultured Pseudomonas sp.]